MSTTVHNAFLGPQLLNCTFIKVATRSLHLLVGMPLQFIGETLSMFPLLIFHHWKETFYLSLGAVVMNNLWWSYVYVCEIGYRAARLCACVQATLVRYLFFPMQSIGILPTSLSGWCFAITVLLCLVAAFHAIPLVNRFLSLEQKIQDALRASEAKLKEEFASSMRAHQQDQETRLHNLNYQMDAIAENVEENEIALEVQGYASQTQRQELLSLSSRVDAVTKSAEQNKTALEAQTHASEAQRHELISQREELGAQKNELEVHKHALDVRDAVLENKLHQQQSAIDTAKARLDQHIDAFDADKRLRGEMYARESDLLQQHSQVKKDYGMGRNLAGSQSSSSRRSYQFPQHATPHSARP